MTNVCQFTSFEDLPQECRLLFDNSGAECFFTSLPWFELFAKHALHEHEKIRIYCSVSGPNASPQFHAALAALERPSHSKLFKPRRITSLSNYYSPLFSPVLKSAECQDAIRQIATEIANETPKWDVVDLKPLEVSSHTFELLKEALASAGFAVQTYFCFGNWYLEVGGRKFHEYFAGLPSALRNTILRKRKKLERSGRAKLSITIEGHELEEAIEAYNRVYIASWKKPEPYPTFIPALIRTCARFNCLRLGIVRIDGQPAAAQLWIIHKGRALIYKLAYDERFRDLSLGTILTATMLEYVIDVDHVQEVDYLTGDDSYKKDWMSHRRERWGILAMNPRTIYGATAIARHIGGRLIKRTVLSLCNLK